MKKQYIAFATDHTGSMGSRKKPAAADYNALIEGVKAASAANGIDTIVSHLKIGHSGHPAPYINIRNSSLAALKPLTLAEYDTDAGETQLFATVLLAIEVLKAVPDYADPDVSFLFLMNTDGGANGGDERLGPKVAAMINELQATDKWTFAFRVPRGYSSTLTRLGIDEGNIMEWELSTQGLQTATAQNTEAMNSFYQNRAAGVKSTRSFYANMKNVTTEEVKASLEDVSAKVTLWPVQTTEHEMDIRSFVEKRLKGGALKKGAAFYQLTKSEDKVQGTKKICIRDKATNAIYYGPAARQLMGVPLHSDVRLKPDDLGKFDVFIQSTSVNRKVQSGSQILYWEDVGVSYKEGPSAR